MNINSADTIHGVFMLQEQQTHIRSIRQSGTLPLAFAIIQMLRGNPKT